MEQTQRYDHYDHDWWQHRELFELAKLGPSLGIFPDSKAVKTKN